MYRETFFPVSRPRERENGGTQGKKKKEGLVAKHELNCRRLESGVGNAFRRIQSSVKSCLTLSCPHTPRVTTAVMTENFEDMNNRRLLVSRSPRGLPRVRGYNSSVSERNRPIA